MAELSSTVQESSGNNKDLAAALAVIDTVATPLKTPEPIKVTWSKGKVRVGGGKNRKTGEVTPAKYEFLDLGFEVDLREDKIAQLIVDEAIKCGYRTQEQISKVQTARIGDYVYILPDDC